MRFIAICLGVLFIGCAEAYSAPPVPVLRLVVNDEAFELPDHESPIKVIAGDKVVFDLSTSEGADRYFVMLDNRRPGQRELITRDKWQHSELRSRAGEYQLRFIVSNDEATVELRRTVQVLCKEPTLPDEPTPPPPQPQPPKPTPAPTPPPVPPPNPPPAPLPPGEFGIAEKVAAIVRKIDSPKRAAEAVQLAEAAEGLAAQIAAGTVGNVTEVLTRIGTGIKALNAPAWSASAAEFAAVMKSTWEAHSAGRLKLTAAGGMVEPAGWSALLREIAVGVRSVK